MLFIFNSEMEVPVRLVHDRSSRIKKKQLQTFYWFRYNRIKRREGAVLEAGRGNLCFVDRASLINLVNKDNLVYNFFKYVNFFLHVSCYYVPICIPDSHPHRVTNTKCPIDTVISPDDGQIVARNL